MNESDDWKKNLLADPLLPKLLKQFHDEISLKASEVDEASNQDWFSLSLGWAIAKGLSPEKAHEFSIFLRYDLDYIEIVESAKKFGLTL